MLLVQHFQAATGQLPFQVLDIPRNQVDSHLCPCHELIRRSIRRFRWRMVEPVFKVEDMAYLVSGRAKVSDFRVINDKEAPFISESFPASPADGMNINRRHMS